MNITKQIATAYYPMTNGLDERWNGTLQTALRKVIDQDTQNDWDEHLDPIMAAYRASRHESTGFSPYFMVFHKEPCLPVDIEYNIRYYQVIVTNHGNYIVANLEICEVNIKLVNIYGPNSDSPSFFKKIQEILVSNEQEYIIICGDFNIALNPTLDTYNYTNVNNPSARKTLHYK